MCLVVYLGSDKERPLIPWDESAPRFHVKAGDNDEDAQKAAIHLRKRFIYYVGSNCGCGCGFRREHDDMIDDANELASIRDNQQCLYDYVAQCLNDGETIELYSCWSGDEALPLQEQRTIMVDDLLSDSFWFGERQRTVVVRNPAGQT